MSVRDFMECVVCEERVRFMAITKEYPDLTTTEYAVGCGCEDRALYITDADVAALLPAAWDSTERP